MSDHRQIELKRDEIDLLGSNIANEVINGFKVQDFPASIGVSLEEFKHIASRLRTVPDDEAAFVTMDEARALCNALALTIEELGFDEFEIRTGHRIDVGNQLHKKLTGFINQDNEE